MRYEVLARISAGDDTVHIGSVDAPNDRLAKLYARDTYDEEDWDFFAVIRAADIHEIETDGVSLHAPRGVER